LVEAEKVAEKVAEKRRMLLGSDHPETLSALLETRRIELGEDSVDAMWTMICLSATYCREGQAHLDEAAQLAERVLERSLEVLGRGHPLTLEGTIALASVYKSQGKAKQAALLEQDALKLQKAFFTRSDHC
jgi:hypothetical protein